jgi:hypothetical protein
MKTLYIPLKECSINNIYNGESATYSIPIYQRNYAWGKDEISTLVQDVYDAFTNKTNEGIAANPYYYIGTLVSYYQGDNVYEIIDGQQRLTTIFIVLKALGVDVKNQLSFKSRNKSSDTIKSIPRFNRDERDDGIHNGYYHALNSIKEIIPGVELKTYTKYFCEQVRIIHYEVPKDIDLNHYFEIMNSRGEQLEKHEIVKAKMISQLSSDEDKKRFHEVWENCSEMGVYIQQSYRKTEVFDKDLFTYSIEKFEDLPTSEYTLSHVSIQELIQGIKVDSTTAETNEVLDSYQPIIDFPNFLLHVLKLIKCQSSNFKITDFNLDDKDLIKEFDRVILNEAFVKEFTLKLLKSKFFLDNFLVHHTHEEDNNDHNPWKLEYYQRGNKDSDPEKKESEYLKNLGGDEHKETHSKLAHLLSMFEVTFTSRQRKNYLFYCLKYLMSQNKFDINHYFEFVRGMAEQFLHKVYLVQENLNEINTPKPGSFDAALLNKVDGIAGWTLAQDVFRSPEEFNSIYGDGNTASNGIPLFIFNYLDYKIWELYSDELKGNKRLKSSLERIVFFDKLGCSDFGLERFDQFYFSRTRRSLEHYFPQAGVAQFKEFINDAQINCLGNYAMIGNEANSSGSNWSPIEKRNRYLDSSGKVRHVSIASLKFFIMMQICEDNRPIREPGHEWMSEDTEMHQKRMIGILT